MSQDNDHQSGERPEDIRKVLLIVAAIFAGTAVVGALRYLNII